jgi:hypothetical protein
VILKSPEFFKSVESQFAFRPSRQFVLVPRELRKVRDPVPDSTSQEYASRVPVLLRPVASPEVASCRVSLRSIELRPVELRVPSVRPVEVRSVLASHAPVACVKSVLRQAFSRVAVQRSRSSPSFCEVASRSVASCVAVSPKFSLPKCSLSSALHSSMRARRAEKVSRLVRRLAKLAPVASV